MHSTCSHNASQGTTPVILKCMRSVYLSEIKHFTTTPAYRNWSFSGALSCWVPWWWWWWESSSAVVSSSSCYRNAIHLFSWDVRGNFTIFTTHYCTTFASANLPTSQRWARRSQPMIFFPTLRIPFLTFHLTLLADLFHLDSKRAISRVPTTVSFLLNTPQSVGGLTHLSLRRWCLVMIGRRVPTSQCWAPSRHARQNCLLVITRALVTFANLPPKLKIYFIYTKQPIRFEAIFDNQSLTQTQIIPTTTKIRKRSLSLNVMKMATKNSFVELTSKSKVWNLLCGSGHRERLRIWKWYMHSSHAAFSSGRG